MTKADMLLIRADAGVQMGTGHVMRCLALAQAWQDVGGRVCFVLAFPVPGLEARLQAEGMQIAHLTVADFGGKEDAAATAVLADHLNVQWVIVDGYHFGHEYQKYLKLAGLHVMFVDDNGHAGAYEADVILNQNIHAKVEFYAYRKLDTQLLLGPTYALLRREFWAWQGWKRVVAPTTRHVLVTLGGSDPDNVTMKVIEALNQLSSLGLEVQVIIGSQYPHLPELATAVTSNSSIQLRLNVTNMPELMAWADVAISAGGSTYWELAFMGLPAVVLILADNQHSLAEGLAKTGAIVNLGWYHLVSAEQIAQALIYVRDDPLKREAMCAIARQLVDGKGAQRVVRMMQSENVFRVRRAVLDDTQRLFEWANDPFTRQMSFRSDPIAWEEHQSWLATVLQTAQVVLMVIEWFTKAGWVAVSQVRIDEEGIVSISLDPGYRGRGWGARILLKAIAYHRDIVHLPRLTAFIKPDNGASRRIFRQVGFVCEGEDLIDGRSALKFVYTYPLREDTHVSGEFVDVSHC